MKTAPEAKFQSSDSLAVQVHILLFDMLLVGYIEDVQDYKRKEVRRQRKSAQ
ncbi:Uncharacterized protein DAT39_005059, partial [Clarias magur]